MDVHGFRVAFVNPGFGVDGACFCSGKTGLLLSSCSLPTASNVSSLLVVQIDDAMDSDESVAVSVVVGCDSGSVGIAKIERVGGTHSRNNGYYVASFALSDSKLFRHKKAVCRLAIRQSSRGLLTLRMVFVDYTTECITHR